ncbi:MAG TPA: efflux RND transporter periplasmic adaptor subunit [Polyangiales bacterium]
MLRRPGLWGLLLLGIAVASFLFLRARGPRVPVATVVHHDLEQHLVASGRVMAPAHLEVATLTTGVVTAVGPREGDTVKAGELLVQLDESETLAQLAQAEGRVAEARIRAERIGSVDAVVASRTLEQAQATYDDASQQYERTVKLVDTGALPHEQRDTARRALQVARAQLETARAEQSAASRGGVNAREANAALSQALAALSLAKLRLSQTRVVALADAVVLTRSVEPGTVVSPSQSLMTLAASGATRLLIQPDERDLSWIRLGARARASADAFPDESFDAEVNYIAPSVDRERGTVDVRLRVPTPPSYLRPDMSVSVDLTVAHKPNAVVIPADAVRGLATPRPWTLVVVQDRAERRELKLGLRGEGTVEVQKGVVPGEQVIVPDGQLVAPGQRVRTRAWEP